jgi:hypothetical protein
VTGWQQYSPEYNKLAPKTKLVETRAIHRQSRWSKDLYDASPDNRDFLLARFQAEEDIGAALEKYRHKIVEQFFPARGDGKLKLAEARKAIRDYRKATGNLTGTIDLMLTYVENGTEFTHEFGDINESFYNSLESVLNEMAQLLMREGKELYPRFRERIRAVGNSRGRHRVGLWRCRA